MHAVYGVICGGKTDVYRSTSEFCPEKSTSNLVDGRGPPISASAEPTIAEVKTLVEGDPHSTVRELSDTCLFLIGTVHAILHDNLHMKKLAARWVSHLLTDEQKKEVED